MANDEGALAELDDLVAASRPLAVAALSVTEIERGLDSNTRERFDSTLADVEVVAYDEQMARRAGIVLRSLDARGEGIGAVDAMVAATALERDGAVVTRNVSEFRRVDGLRVVPY